MRLLLDKLFLFMFKNKIAKIYSKAYSSGFSDGGKAVAGQWVPALSFEIEYAYSKWLEKAQLHGIQERYSIFKD